MNVFVHKYLTKPLSKPTEQQNVFLQDIHKFLPIEKQDIYRLLRKIIETFNTF